MSDSQTSKNQIIDLIRKNKSTTAILTTTVLVALATTSVLIKKINEPNDYKKWSKNDLCEYLALLGKNPDLALHIQEKLWTDENPILIDGQFGPESRYALSKLSQEQLAAFAQDLEEEASQSPAKPVFATKIMPSITSEISVKTPKCDNADTTMEEYDSNLQMLQLVLGDCQKHDSFVLSVQQEINKLNKGRKPLNEDGIFGQETKNALSTLKPKELNTLYYTVLKKHYYQDSRSYGE